MERVDDAADQPATRIEGYMRSSETHVLYVPDSQLDSPARSGEWISLGPGLLDVQREEGKRTVGQKRCIDCQIVISLQSLLTCQGPGLSGAERIKGKGKKGVLDTLG